MVIKPVYFLLRYPINLVTIIPKSHPAHYIFILLLTG